MEELTASWTRPGSVADGDHVGIWLADFEEALRAGDGANLAALFADECHWRDLLAFTWNISPHEGTAAIVSCLLAVQPTIQAQNFRVATNRTPSSEVKRAGVSVIEAIFEF